MKTILVTGANGQVGWELQRNAAYSGKIVALDRDALDLSSLDAIRQTLREIRPDIIINPAAYTAVDKAEAEPDLAMIVNGIAPGVLAEEAKKLDALLVHYSTDYVFDGVKSSPYVETDAPNPQSAYGKSKLAGEQAIQAVGGKHLILRTSWVYGVHGGNFVKTILRLARERSELRIVADQFGAPTWARMLARAAMDMAGRFEPEKSGVYHLVAGGRTSWFDFAEAIIGQARRYDAALAGKPLTIRPITTEEYPLPAKRPANSSLSTEKVGRTFGVTLPNWEQELAECMEAYYRASAS